MRVREQVERDHLSHCRSWPRAWRSTHLDFPRAHRTFDSLACPGAGRAREAALAQTSLPSHNLTHAASHPSQVLAERVKQQCWDVMAERGEHITGMKATTLQVPNFPLNQVSGLCLYVRGEPHAWCLLLSLRMPPTNLVCTLVAFPADTPGVTHLRAFAHLLGYASAQPHPWPYPHQHHTRDRAHTRTHTHTRTRTHRMALAPRCSPRWPS